VNPAIRGIIMNTVLHGVYREMLAGAGPSNVFAQRQFGPDKRPATYDAQQENRP
jgi:hypothetical protein